MSKFCPHCEASIVLPDNEFYITCESCAKGIGLDGSGNITMEEEEIEEQNSELEEIEEVSAKSVQEGTINAEDVLDMDSVSHLEEVESSTLEDEGLKSFSAEAMSLDFNKSCLYDLMISNIDSVDMQSHLISILQDDRLQLDMTAILERFKNNISGRISLKDLNVLKLTYIVQNIYNSSISVELYWQQKVLE